MSFAKTKKNFSFTNKATSIPPQPYLCEALKRSVNITYACIKALKKALKSSKPEIHYEHFHGSFFSNNTNLKIGESKMVWYELRKKSEKQLDAIIKLNSISTERSR